VRRRWRGKFNDAPLSLTLRFAMVQILPNYFHLQSFHYLQQFSVASKRSTQEAFFADEFSALVTAVFVACDFKISHIANLGSR